MRMATTRGGEGGGRQVGKESGGGGVGDEVGQAAHRVGGAHGGEVQDDDKREEAEAAVAEEGLAVFEPDVEYAGHDHGEHEKGAAEELEALVGRDAAGGEEVLALGDELFVLFPGDAGAGLDDGLPALDLHDDGAEVGEGEFLLAAGGVVVVSEVGRDAVAEETEEGDGGFAADAFGGEVDAEEGEGVFEGLDVLGAHLVLRGGDLENGDIAGAGPGAEGGVVVHALGVDLAEYNEGVLHDAEAALGVAEAEEGGHIVGRGAVGPGSVEGGDEGGEGLAAGGDGGGVEGGGGVGGGVSGKVCQQAGEVGLKLAERLKFETENRGDAVADLFTELAGLLVALVGEGNAGGEADGGGLVGQHREVGHGDADKADKHDGGDGREEDEGGDEATLFEEGHEAGRGLAFTDAFGGTAKEF